jgi:hypothetical protein
MTECSHHKVCLPKLVSQKWLFLERNDDAPERLLACNKFLAGNSPIHLAITIVA